MTTPHFVYIHVETSKHRQLSSCQLPTSYQVDLTPPNLYKPSTLPDDSISAPLLSSLLTLARPPAPVRAVAAARATAPLVQQLSATVLFLAAYGLLHAGRARLEHLAAANALACAAIVTCAGAGARRPASVLRAWPHATRMLATLVAALLVLAPALKTLTQAFCNDSVWALTTLLAAVHIATHDYKLSREASLRVPGALSLNAALCASVLLASRLPTAALAFFCIALAVQLFALLPLLRNRLRARSDSHHAALAVATAAVAAAALGAASAFLAAVFLAALFFIAVVYPLAAAHLSGLKVLVSSSSAPVFPRSRH